MKKNLINIFKVSSDNFEAANITQTILLKSLKRGGTVFIDVNDDIIENFTFAPNLSKRTLHIDPTMKNTVSINPLAGDEEYMVHNFTKVLDELNTNCEQNKREFERFAISNSLKVLKRLNGDKVTLLDLASFLQNVGGQGRKIVTQFSRLTSPSQSIAKENNDIATWFFNEYFVGENRSYDTFSGVRSQIINLVSNSYLNKILIPSNENKEVNLGKHLASGGNIIINLSQDLFGEYNGNFLLLTFFSQLKDNLLKENYIDEEINIYINHSERIMSVNAINSMIVGRNYEEHKITFDKIQIKFPYNKLKTTKKNDVEKINENINEIITPDLNINPISPINVQLPNKREELIEISNNLLKEKKDKIKQEEVINWNNESENLLLDDECEEDDVISCEIKESN